MRGGHRMKRKNSRRGGIVPMTREENQEERRRREIGWEKVLGGGVRCMRKSGTSEMHL